MKYIKDIGLFEAEHIDYNKIDLRAEFDHINTRLFDGKVKPVPLRWMNSKNTVGLMSYDGQNIRDIGISYYYKMSLQELRNVLAHEMIHAYLEQTGVKERDAHGPRFTRMREELNKKFPEYNIVKSENAEEFEVSSYARIKEYGVVIFDEIEAISLVVVPVDLITDNNLADFIVWLKKYGLHIFRKLTVSVYKSSHPEIAKFKMKKSLTPKRMETYVITRELADEIKKDGTLVLEEKLK